MQNHILVLAGGKLLSLSTKLGTVRITVIRVLMSFVDIGGQVLHVVTVLSQQVLAKN